MCSHGFEKTGPLDYCKLSEDGETKIIVRSPNMINGFYIGAQFADYGEYDGTFKKSRIRYYEHELLLCNAGTEEYSDSDIGEAVKAVVDGIGIYIMHGKKAIRDNVDQWVFGVFNDRERNDILICLGLEPIDPYGIPYLVETVERIKHGGFCSMTYDEYYSHKDYYDKYCEYGCEISFHPNIQKVWINYKL